MESVSVVIPVYDPIGSQKERILRMAHSLAIQDYPIAQVVITANHDIPYQAELAKVLSSVDSLLVRRIPSLTAPQNLNLGLSFTTEPFVKILFQDDFLMGTNHLSRVIQRLSQSSAFWLATRSVGFDEETATVFSDAPPKFKESIRNGVNTIGMPSAVTVRKSAIAKFSEDLLFMFDCEWYLTMAHNFGPPVVANDAAVAIGMHPDQATHSVGHKLQKEKKLTRDKHRRIGIFNKTCSCQSPSPAS